MDEQWPPQCPNCDSSDVECSREQEYTGGGYADYWYHCRCTSCGHTWETDPESDYA